MIFSSLNFTKRIDSEYYKKDLLIIQNNIINRYNLKISDTNIKVLGGKRLPLGVNFTNNGIKYARAEDIKYNFLDIDSSPFISIKTHNALQKYVTKENDIILTIVGNSIGDVALNKLKCTINLTENCVRLVNAPVSLFLYLNCRYGQAQILREKVGTAQPKLAIERIREFYIPHFDIIESYLSNLVSVSWQCIKDSKSIYQQAEELLNEYLQIDDITQKNSYTVKNLSESFNKSGRMDAEYYQPKYDILFNALQGITTVNLGDIVKIKKSIEPGSEAYQDEGIPFIRVSDIDKFGISESAIKLSLSVVPNIESLYPQKDTILLSKDGSIGIAYKVQENLQAVTSGALLHLTIKNKTAILPDYLTLVLNSQIVQLQAERDCNGAVIQHWKPFDIEKVVIPVIEIEKQKEIADKVQESFRLRKESKRLLDCAIKTVEMAIETDEETALQWLNEQE